jgi:L-ascorbate metabolism protein UlaG (beta-lactamase superfamily)
MAVNVRWLGHSAFHISGAGADVLVDPFLTGNPKAAATADEVSADVIALSHGHGDHYGDTIAIAQRTGATVLAITELAADDGTFHPPAGLLIHYGGHLIYHLGDTALFSDLQLIARRGDKVELALVPIGGHYTMDRFDAVTAVEFINPSQVIPIHYNTMPQIETDAQAFKADVQNAGFSQVYVLEPGDTHTLR